MSHSPRIYFWNWIESSCWKLKQDRIFLLEILICLLMETGLRNKGTSYEDDNLKRSWEVTWAVPQNNCLLERTTRGWAVGKEDQANLANDRMLSFWPAQKYVTGMSIFRIFLTENKNLIALYTRKKNLFKQKCM